MLQDYSDLQSVSKRIHRKEGSGMRILANEQIALLEAEHKAIEARITAIHAARRNDTSLGSLEETFLFAPRRERLTDRKLIIEHMLKEPA